jgi:hypothetical protein
VSAADLGSTLLARVPGAGGLPGRDLLAGEEPDPLPVVSEGTLYYEDRIAVRDGDMKLVLWRDSGRRQLYDLGEDPLESRDLSRARPREVERLSALAGGVARGGDDHAERAAIGGRRLQSLRSLGYVR